MFKNVLTAFSFILILASTNNLSAIHNPIDWKSEILSYLGDFEKLNIREMPNKILVDFILNETGEIMVLSTSHSELDQWLKSKLNYKKIGFNELETMQKYTLPIVFNKI